MSLTKTEIKYLHSLQNKKNRKQEKRFLCDGVRLLEEALAAGYLPQSVLYSPSEISERGKKLVSRFEAKNVKSQSISAKECHSLSDTKTPQGLIALFSTRNYTLDQQLASNFRKILICDNIGDPGNLGTLCRSAAAFNFALIITTDGTAELTNPKTIRSSMGAFFRMPFIEGTDPSNLVELLHRHGYAIFNADVKGKYISDKTPRREKIALVIGSEASGAGQVFLDKADFRLKIPMSKKVESLNAAMAGTTLMFWMDLMERAES